MLVKQQIQQCYKLIMDSSPSPSLPIIQFSDQNLLSTSSLAKNVVTALEQYGCFIAIYPKFSSKMYQAIYQSSKDLFDLPTLVKVQNTSATPSHGYVGQVPIIPLYEGLGIEDATTLEGVQKFTNLMWPHGNDGFSETTLGYSRLVSELDQLVMKMVSEIYGIDKSYKLLLGATSYLLRLIKYRIPEKGEPEIGIVPHTDKSFMSILHQCQVKGLEIMTKDGKWITINPSPSSFIVMAGDACMAWTNGRIQPCSHRVIMRGTEERYSLGLFSFIKDVKIEVPLELVDDDGHSPLQFKPFDHYKYIYFYYTEEGKRSKCPIKDYCGV